MLRYIFRRVLLMIPVMLGAIIIVFTINFCSEVSPAVIALGSHALDEELLAKTEHEMGLDRPYLVQLGEYLLNLIRGDLGDSYVYPQKVATLIKARIPNTLKISVMSICFAAVIGIPLGVIAALRQNTIVDYGTTTFAVLLNSMPSFLVAVLLMIVFAVKLRWFPVSGLDNWTGYVLPIAAATVTPITQNARMTRSAVLEVIRLDYIRTARSKGIDEGTIRIRHVLRNALIPILTLIGGSLGHCVAGSILVEKIFNVPGMGTLISQSISVKDYITVQGCVIVCALFVTVMNLLTDLAYAAVDPRIRAQLSVKKRRREKPAAVREG